MTAVDDYQAGTSDFNRDADHRMLSEIAGPAHFVMRLADAAIAELEAELAALKARRCETCRSQEEGLSYCSTLDVLTTEGFYCADWEERR